MTSPSQEQPPVQSTLDPSETSIWHGEPVISGPVPGYSQPVTSSNAIVALVLSIVSWLVLPLVLAIVALVFARKAEREIAGSQLNGGQLNGSQRRIGGENMVTAAKILAWINIGFFTALLVLAVFAVFFLMLAGVASN